MEHMDGSHALASDYLRDEHHKVSLRDIEKAAERERFRESVAKYSGNNPVLKAVVGLVFVVLVLISYRQDS